MRPTQWAGIGYCLYFHLRKYPFHIDGNPTHGMIVGFIFKRVGTGPSHSVIITSGPDCWITFTAVKHL